MSKKYEIENKYLVKPPSSWQNLSEIFDNLIDVKRISQTYLKPVGTDPCARVRKTCEGFKGDTNIAYHFNQKIHVEPGVNEEKEHEISEKEYKQYVKNIHPDKVEIEKTRFVFKYDDQVFELDVFKGPLKGLGILEIELDNKGDKVKLPPFLEVIREITEDKDFNNFSLASKRLHEKIKSEFA